MLFFKGCVLYRVSDKDCTTMKMCATHSNKNYLTIKMCITYKDCKIDPIFLTGQEVVRKLCKENSVTEPV